MLVLVVVLLAGCAPPTLVARALRARGGPLHGLVREVEAQVVQGFPGAWRWRTAFLPPERYAWTIYTSAEPDHYVFDGATVQTWVGSRLVTAEAGAAAPFRTHARFAAVMNLDVLALPGVQVMALAPADLPAGAASGLAATFADDGSRYRLGFDARGLLVSLAGPIALPPTGTGELVASFGDFRPTRGRLLPYRTAYTFDGAPLATERVLAACPEASGLTAERFATPAALPACDPGARLDRD